MAEYSKRQLTPLMVKFGINAEDELFNNVITLFDGQTPYQIWAIKVLWGTKCDFETIVRIKTWADNNPTLIKDLIQKNIISYTNQTNINNLLKEIEGLTMITEVKKTVDKFNTAQRNMLRERIQSFNVTNGLEAKANTAFKNLHNLLKKFETISPSRKGLFIQKASGYTNVNDLLHGIADTLVASYDWNKEDLLGFVERNTTKDTKVVYNNGNIVVLQVACFEDSHKLCGNGRTGWCITRENSYFKSYILDKTGNRQYFYFDFSKPEKDELAHIGFTANNTNGIVNAHSTRNSSLLGGGLSYKGRTVTVHDVLGENGVPPQIYLELKNLRNYRWDMKSFLDLVEKNVKHLAISFADNNRVIVCCLSNQGLNIVCDHTLIDANKFNCANNKVYVLVDFNLNKEDNKSVVLMYYSVDRYKTLSLNAAYDAYNANFKPYMGYLEEIGITRDMYLEREDIDPRILLHKYINENSEQSALNLLEENADLDVNYEFENQSPIFLAIQKNMFNLFERIIQTKSFNLNALDIFGETIFGGLLYEYVGLIANDKDNKTGITNIKRMLDIIADSDFDFNKTNVNLDNAINIACSFEETNWLVEKLLAKKDVDINVVNDYNCSALGCAIYGNNPKAIQMLATRPDFVVRDADRELAKEKGINLNAIISAVTVNAA